MVSEAPHGVPSNMAAASKVGYISVESVSWESSFVKGSKLALTLGQAWIIL